jgi:UDP-glucose 4-epimerase
MSLSCLVLGGSGFLGSHLCEALLLSGHRVKIAVPEGVGLHNLTGILNQIEVLRLDLNEAAKVNEIGGGIDRVFHLACTTRPKTSNDSPVRDLEENLVATVRILDSCVANNVGRIIFVSSGGTVYGNPKSLPISEEHPKAPICSYGIHKLTIEHYLRLYESLYGLNYRVARISNAYGERQSIYDEQGLIGTVLEKLLTGQTINVYGNGETVRDYVYVTDAISALLRLAEVDTSSRVFNVGSGCGVSVMEVIRTVESVFGQKANLQFFPARPIDVAKNILDISRIRMETGWAPRVSFEEGIARTVQWWCTTMGTSVHRTSVHNKPKLLQIGSLSNGKKINMYMKGKIIHEKR